MLNLDMQLATSRLIGRNATEYPKDFRFLEYGPEARYRPPLPVAQVQTQAQIRLVKGLLKTSQAEAATAQVQRWEWKVLTSRFRCRNVCYISSFLKSFSDPSP